MRVGSVLGDAKNTLLCFCPFKPSRKGYPLAPSLVGGTLFFDSAIHLPKASPSQLPKADLFTFWSPVLAHFASRFPKGEAFWRFLGQVSHGFPKRPALAAVAAVAGAAEWPRVAELLRAAAGGVGAVVLSASAGQEPRLILSSFVLCVCVFFLDPPVVPFLTLFWLGEFPC